MDDWKEDILEWHAGDLYERGYIFNQSDWEQFSSVMSLVAMEFFIELVDDDDMFNLEQVAIDMDNYEFPEPIDAPDFPHGEVL
jgi:hypothetical protein